MFNDSAKVMSLISVILTAVCIGLIASSEILGLGAGAIDALYYLGFYGFVFGNSAKGINLTTAGLKGFLERERKSKH